MFSYSLCCRLQKSRSGEKDYFFNSKMVYWPNEDEAAYEIGRGASPQWILEQTGFPQ